MARLLRLGAWLPLLFVTTTAAWAEPFTISTTLSGDPRLQNPDGISVAVTIAGDSTTNYVDWLVDLVMDATYPNARLDEFYFNVASDPSLFSFSNVSPGGWGVAADESVQGGGRIGFDFGASRGRGGLHVTNSQSLSFRMVWNSGFANPLEFLLADLSCSSDATLGCGQLGAHIQSLNAGFGQSDSGFALGNYNPTPVPEPGSLLLLGTGLGALVVRMRRARGRREEVGGRR